MDRTTTLTSRPLGTTPLTEAMQAARRAVSAYDNALGGPSPLAVAMQAARRATAATADYVIFGRRPSLVRRLAEIAAALAAALIIGMALLSVGLRLTQHQAVVIRGASMSPTLPFGALIVIDTNDRTPVVGDVATYIVPGGTMITHRITAVIPTPDGLAYHFQGDANKTADSVDVPQAWLVGRVALFVPYLGYLVGILGLPSGFFGALATVIALHLFARGGRRWRRRPRR